MYRNWRENDDRDYPRDRRNTRTNNYYSYYDPISNYYPVYDNYQPYRRESVVRSIISSFFSPDDNYYYQPYQTYTAYQPSYAYRQQPYYPSYSPAYYGNGYGYDTYGYSPYQPYYGTQIFGGSGLKSSLLNVGLELLQGFLGQGYLQGLDQGRYARDVYGTRNATYYDPYAAPQQYYSPYVSSFADQRQLFEEGYRLGYQDAMRDQDPYGMVGYQADNNVDMISQFLANSLLTRI
jgi:hypothetical protein